MLRLLGCLVALVLTAAPASLHAAESTANADAFQAQEVQIGRHEYDALAGKGEIIHDSPYYAVLAPIAAQIKRVADPQYFHPFTFILVHEKQPNAFAVPGGNVYVTDSLMRFVENREELAGVLCHETSHTIHHDVVNNYARDQRAAQNTAIGATVLNLILGGRGSGVVNTLAQYDVLATMNGFSREVETAADLKGADTCAAAGSNPWGMVWLFERFEKASSGGSMEMLADHPRDDHRISDLETHFLGNPARFGHYSNAIAGATKLARPRVSLEPASEATP